MGPLKVIARIIFWKYERGTWQYDLLCALILAFIFLTPPTVFEGRLFTEQNTAPQLEEMEKESPPPKKTESARQCRPLQADFQRGRWPAWFC